MMLITGKEPAEQIKGQIKLNLSQFNTKPGLHVIIVGNDPASETYVSIKHKTATSLGINSVIHRMSVDSKESDIIDLINKLNADSLVHGILVQLPLPQHLDSVKITSSLDPLKDVDGLHPYNMGHLILGTNKGFMPCTPKGILHMLSYYNIPTEGRSTVILGRSNIVGKPLAIALMSCLANANVTLLHSKSKNIEFYTRNADILISAVGHPNLITRNMVKEGVTIIDVGTTRTYSKEGSNTPSLSGDVDFENVKDLCYAITPVPGGIGPLTIAMLMLNTCISFYQKS